MITAELFEGVESVFGPDPVIADIAARRAEYDRLAAKWPVMGRQLADSRAKVAWAKARSHAIGGSDAASFAKIESAPLYLRAKMYNPFGGNGYTKHGNDREPHMLAALHREQNFTLFRSPGNPRHVATPDGIKLGADGSVLLVQCKTVLQKTKNGIPVEPFTSAKGDRVIPPDYRRQMFWEQYVMGAEQTVFAWEEHIDGRPTTPEPDTLILERDDFEISKLITIADLVLAGMDAAAQFEKEMQES